jgi:hypothetical protein
MRHFFITAVGALVAVLTCAEFCAMAGEPVSGLPVITPSPRHMAWTESGGPGWLDLKQLKSIVIPEECRSVIVGGVEQFAARLRELRVDEAAAAKREIQATPTFAPGGIYLGVMPHASLESRLAALPAPGAEGYRLVVDAQAVFILGNDLPGLYYGLMTLRQLVDAQGRLARVTIADWPDMRLRGAYVAGNTGLEARILQCAALKLNFMLFECGDFFSLDDADTRARWQSVFALCRKHFIEPVPELQSLGWGHSVLIHQPAAAEGVYVEKRRFKVEDGAVQSPDPPPAPPAAIADAGFEEANVLTAWTADRRGEGVTVDPEGPHTGNGSLRITRTEQGTTRVFQDMSVRPQADYELSCFLRTKGVAQGHAYIEAYGLLADGHLGAFLGHSPLVQGDCAWQRLATAFNSDNYTKLQVYLRIQDATGTAWFDDVSITGTPALNPLGNVLLTPSAPLVVQDESGTTTYEAGKDFQVVAAPVSFPFGLGDPLRVAILPGSRIQNGTGVLLSYHQAPRGSVTCCPSEPLYQEFMRTTLHHVVQCLKPKYIHIGHDEPRVLKRDRRCTARRLSNSQLFADDIQRMQEFVREVDPAISLMMWSDAVNPYHNGPSLGMNDAAALIPKDVVQCPWWYDWPDRDDRIEKSIAFFLDQGFDMTGSPWFDHRNVQQWAETLHKLGTGNPHALGLIYTSWGDTTENPWQALETAAQYAWTVDSMPLEEFLRSHSASHN